MTAKERLTQALKNIEAVENFTGIEAQNLRSLNENTSLSEIEEAESADQRWFRGYAETILTLV